MEKLKAEERKELDRIAKAHADELLRPADIVEAARGAENPLHHRFEWDDSKAAQQYRLEQARDIIQVYVMVIEPANQEPTRVYVSLREDRRRDGGGYRHIMQVLCDKDKRAALLREALQDLERWQEKYRQLCELKPIFKAAEKLRKKKAS